MKTRDENARSPSGRFVARSKALHGNPNYGHTPGTVIANPSVRID